MMFVIKIISSKNNRELGTCAYSMDDWEVHIEEGEQGIKVGEASLKWAHGWFELVAQLIFLVAIRRHITNTVCFAAYLVLV